MSLELGYEYYYMGMISVTPPCFAYCASGYYIHSCAKMRYKGSFSPSYLLGKPSATTMSQPV